MTGSALDALDAALKTAYGGEFLTPCSQLDREAVEAASGEVAHHERRVKYGRKAQRGGFTRTLNKAKAHLKYARACLRDSEEYERVHGPTPALMRASPLMDLFAPKQTTDRLEITMNVSPPVLPPITREAHERLVQAARAEEREKVLTELLEGFGHEIPKAVKAAVARVRAKESR